ncbi:5-methylcytosine-specific restriction protein A [Rossellomorea aquimaris]|uniref:5-methylcytosine-specific restriction protein A n=1 Tax=Rossellomorea aquimaris TaxID=189382 RepID=A0A366ECQ3_9BACI|nr:5-methylcytosine-specific restriction protein A [Rossellomorea aquimaris]
MVKFDWDCRDYHLFSTSNIENRVNGDKLFVSFLMEIENQQKDMKGSFRISEIADLIPKGTAGIQNHSTYGYSFMSMLSTQKYRDYFVFENKNIQDELTTICNNNSSRDDYYWRKHYINEKVKVNPKYIRRQPMPTPITISKNNQLLYKATNIQEAAEYLATHLNIKKSKCYDPIERGYVYNIPYQFEGDEYRFKAPPEIAANRRQELEERDHKNARRIWLVPANPNEYDLERAFSHFSTLDWKRSFNYENGDILFFYVSGSVRKIRYKVEVIEGLVQTYDTIYDQSFWVDQEKYDQSIGGDKTRVRLVDVVDTDDLSLYQLREHGLKGNIQGSMKLTGELRDYIMSFFQKDLSAEVYPDEVPEMWEGKRRTITVNSYERNPLARKRCMDHYGAECQVCKMDFEDTYGEVGRDFIHVHHITPLHEIQKGYKVDPIEDLIPVCPNCHAMLHRKEDGVYLTVVELKERLKIKEVIL